jgi:hypothetical protein
MYYAVLFENQNGEQVGHLQMIEAESLAEAVAAAELRAEQIEENFASTNDSDTTLVRVRSVWPDADENLTIQSVVRRKSGIPNYPAYWIKPAHGRMKRIPLDERWAYMARVPTKASKIIDDLT